MNPQQIQAIQQLKDRNSVKICSSREWSNLCYFTKNILFNRIPLTPSQLTRLNKYSDYIKMLGYPNRRKYSYKQRRKDFLHQRGDLTDVLKLISSIAKKL